MNSSLKEEHVLIQYKKHNRFSYTDKEMDLFLKLTLSFVQEPSAALFCTHTHTHPILQKQGCPEHVLKTKI